MRRYALGLDFGTESVRALIVDCTTGAEAAQSVAVYPHGVICTSLPGDARPLPPEFALQHPGDYVASAVQVIREVLKRVPPNEIIGLGVDFTACTILPVRADGSPLMMDERYCRDPHAWVKLWKHHAAQPEAEEATAVARARQEPFLRYYSGVIYSEWMLPKCWEIARHSPAVYSAAELIVDAGDWIVQQMTGRFVRNACAAGYKGLWNAELGLPASEFLTALDPALANLREKWLQEIYPPGRAVGGLNPAFAVRCGLRPGTPVSAATIDAHSGVAGMGVCRAGTMAIIMGTSACHLVLSKELRFFDGFAGVVQDGILPGWFGYESGQAAVGDIFAWFAKSFATGGDDAFGPLSRAADQLSPGESGLLVLDWLNGCRSVLMDADLSGLILGVTLATQPAHIYRALIEGCALGTRTIIDSYRSGGLPIEELVVCGGLTQDPLIMQIHADATGLPIRVAASQQSVALGAAIFGALAAGREGGGFDRAADAIAAMTGPAARSYTPDPRAAAIYDALYELYQGCHDHFGRNERTTMQRLRGIRNQACKDRRTGHAEC